MATNVTITGCSSIASNRVATTKDVVKLKADLANLDVAQGLVTAMRTARQKRLAVLLGTSGPVTPPPPATVITDAQASRFLQQATMGATKADIAEVKQLGYAGWLDAQIAMPRSTTVWDRMGQRHPAVYAEINSLDHFDDAVWDLLTTAPDQLRHRVGMALGDFIVTSMTGLDLNWINLAVAHHYDNLLGEAFGNYRTLLTRVTLSLAMGKYLSYVNNKKAGLSPGAQPDENYARELIQLFTIGLHQLNMDGTVRNDAAGNPLENYTQADVSQLARVMTGLVTSVRYDDPEIARAPMVMERSWNETGPSTFLGRTVTEGGLAAIEAALDTVFQHPSCPPFVCRQLIQALVVSNPSPGYVKRVATVFADNGKGVRGDMAATVRAILLDSEARALGADGRVRPPVQRFTAWARANGMAAPVTVGNTASLDALGQSTGRAPSVFGWFRPGYTPPASAIQAQGKVAPELQGANEQSVIGYVNFMERWIGKEPARLSVDDLDLLLTAGTMTADTRARIAKATEGVADPVSRARIAALLVVNAPEFLVAR